MGLTLFYNSAWSYFYARANFHELEKEQQVIQVIKTLRDGVAGVSRRSSARSLSIVADRSELLLARLRRKRLFVSGEIPSFPHLRREKKDKVGNILNV